MTETDQTTPFECVVLTILRAPLSTNVEVQLFKRAVDFEVVDITSPDFEKTLFSQTIFALTKYICQQESVPEPTVLLLSEKKHYDKMMDMFNVPGVVSCRPCVAADAHYKVHGLTVRL